RRARAEFGGVEARKDECREASGLRVFDELRADATYSLRLLRRSPGFTAVALLSLGLGIGANTALFSLVDMVLLKSLPVTDPQRLFFIDNSGGKSGGSNGPPYPCFELLRDNNRFLSDIAAFDERLFKVTIDGVPEEIRGQYASGSFFDVLGVRAVHGRVLTAEDDSVPGSGGPQGAVAVISHGLWQRRFGMDPAVLGKSIQVGTDWVTIVGVTPPGFLGLQVGMPTDITIPIMLTGRQLQSRQSWWLSVIGRLAPGATMARARADLERLWDAYMTENGFPREKRDYFSGIELVPASRGSNALRRELSEPLLIVFAIVALVLLVGCANVANLLLARATARRGEMSVRLAIGASRGRLIRQLLTEGAVLASSGALLGLLFAHWAVTFIVGVFAGRVDGSLDPEFDLRVLAFTAAVAGTAALLFSVAPALHVTRVDAAKPPASGATSPPASRLRLSQSLVVIQVMLSVVLLSGAALFVRTLQNLQGVDSGFERERVLTMLVAATVPRRSWTPDSTPEESKRDFARLGAIWEAFVDRVAGLPGVTAAAVATMSPLSGRNRGVVIAVRGAPAVAKEVRGIRINHVTPGYFQTLDVTLLKGRAFTSADRSTSLRVAILNDTAASAYFGEQNPIGRKVNFPGQWVADDYEIVGVVRDVRYEDLRSPDERMAYLPLYQPIDPITSAVVLVRGGGDVTRLTQPVRDVATKAVPGGFVTGVKTIEQQMAASLRRERLLSMLATFFGGLALVLACIGLYGVMSFGVIRRTREIGIRIAIGARHPSVIWMVIREMLAWVAVGVLVGAIAAVFASRYVEGQLFGVAPGDPLAILTAVLLLLAIAAIAGFLPARRASRIDPVVALRCE
ncbi:MAG: ABC transporter permease, partial [Vicinamibacterales bacterium]